MKDMIIVGSQGAIGHHLALAFDKEYKVHGTFHENLAAPAGNSRIMSVDVTVPESCRTYIDVLKQRIGNYLGNQVVLINAFGISIDSIGHKIDADDWWRVLDVNLAGVLNMCQAILPLMRSNGWGRIINLSSVVGHVGVPGTAAYAASKAGLEGLTRTLAVENAPRNITVNSLVLGYMSVGLIETVPDSDKRWLQQTIPARHFGHPDNIVSAVQFLIDADYVTGASIVIDGGFLCT